MISPNLPLDESVSIRRSSGGSAAGAGDESRGPGVQVQGNGLGEISLTLLSLVFEQKRVEAETKFEETKDKMAEVSME